MDKINNLLKLATSYCERATWSYLVNKAEAKSLIKEAVESFTMPDDPEDDPESESASSNKYDDIINIARQIRDPELASELLLLAELYKKSIEVNGGYSSLNKSIGNIINMYLEDEDDPEQEAVEDLLNQVVKDLRERAGGPGALAKPDNPQAIAALKEVKDKYNSESIAEDLEELNKGQFDPTAGLGGGGDGGAAPNRGIMFRSRKTPKEWANIFNTEKENYQDKLLTETNKFIRDKYSKLIEVLGELSTATTTELNLLEQISALQDSDPKLNNALIEVRKLLKDKKEERRSLQQSIRNHNLDAKQKSLEEDIKNVLGPNKGLYKPSEEVYIRANSGDVRAREHIRLYHEIELQKTLKSNDIGKTQERVWRTRLIKSMSGGNWPGLETLRNMEANIEKFSKPPYRTPKTVADRKIVEERGQQQGRKETPEYEPAKGGRRVPMEKLPPEQQIDLENASFDALVYQFQIDIASAVQAARQIIYEIAPTKTTKKQIIPEYKALIDEISEAIRNQSKAKNATELQKARSALQMAKDKLRVKVIADSEAKKPFITGYVNVIRLEPHFRKILASIKEVTKNPSKKELESGKQPKMDAGGNLIRENFSEEDKVAFSMILNDMKRLRELYAKYYTGIENVEKRGNTRFKKVIDDMGKIITRLALDLGVHPPEKKKLLPGKSEDLKNIWEQIKSTSHIKERAVLFALAQENNIEKLKSKKQLYDRKRIEEIAKNQLGREEIPEYKPTKGGRRVPIMNLPLEQQINFGQTSFSGLVLLFQQGIATSTAGTRDYVANSKYKGNPALKPYVDELSKAIRTGDIQQKYKIITDLKSKIAGTIANDAALIKMLKYNRIVPHLYDLRNQFKILSKAQNPKTGKWHLNEEDKNLAIKAITKAARIQKLFDNYYGPHSKTSIAALPNTMAALNAITNELMLAIHNSKEL